MLNDIPVWPVWGAEMIGLLVQMLSLFSGLMVNFLTPLIFGVTQYGVFIKANILVYVFHRFSDVSSESLIALNTEGSIFIQSLIFNLFYFAIFCAISQFFDIGSPWLLGSMLLSSSVLLTLYSQKRIKAVLLFLLSVVSVFIFQAGLVWAGRLPFGIEELMVFSTYPPAIIGFLMLAWFSRHELERLSSYTSLWRAVTIFPRMVSLTLVFNLLTNFLPYVATKILMPREIGILRIMLAVVQSVSSIFPLNIKQIFSTLVGNDKKERLYTALMQVSAVYFLGLACTILLLAYFYYPLQDYVRLLAILPLFFWSMLTERLLQASLQGGKLVALNLVFAVAILGFGAISTSLDALIMLYVISIAAYCNALLHASGLKIPMRYYVLSVACVLQSIAIEISIPLTLLFALVTLVGLVYKGSSVRADIKILRGEIK